MQTVQGTGFSFEQGLMLPLKTAKSPVPHCCVHCWTRGAAAYLQTQGFENTCNYLLINGKIQLYQVDKKKYIDQKQSEVPHIHFRICSPLKIPTVLVVVRILSGILNCLFKIICTNPHHANH